MDEYPTNAARIVAAIMRAEGWNQREFAKYSDMDERTVRRWLNGSSNPTESKLADKVRRVGHDPSSYGLRELSVVQPARDTTTSTEWPEEPPEWFTERAAKLQQHMEAVERKIERLLQECHGAHIHERHEHDQSDN